MEFTSQAESEFSAGNAAGGATISQELPISTKLSNLSIIGRERVGRL
jgi:hypothetical protein